MLPIVADESVDAPIIAALRIKGYVVRAVAEEAPSISDWEVISLAVQDQAALITLDRDFGELVFAREERPPPAIIYVRDQGLTVAEVISKILQCLEQDDLVGTFKTAARRIRTRRLPRPMEQ
jgi:predicted nuclease of predicted toxin-antitoxin system